MNLGQMLQAVECLAVKGSERRDITGVTCDSRQVRPGYLFVAVPGAQRDGWTFVHDALARGAAAVVTEHTEAAPRADATFVAVRDARLALGRLAAAQLDFPSARLHVTGVTGTSGKTTVCSMVRELLQAAGRPAGLLTTVAYEFGGRVISASRTTPDAAMLQGLLAQMAGAGCRAAVVEVSSHAVEQKRIAGVDFDVGVFTNLTHEHLDYHGTMEAYFEAKAGLFLGLGGGKQAVAAVNTDDAWGRRLAQLPGVKAPVLAFGTQAPAEVRAEDLRTTASGAAFRLVTPWGQADVRSRLLGRFNVLNMLAAAAAAGSAGVPVTAIAQTLAGVHGVRGRLEEVPTGRGFRVFVDYAHKVDALDQVLAALRELAPGRLICVFGCGGNRDREKRPAMGRVAAGRADHTIITSDNPRKEDPQAILAEIRGGVPAGASLDVIEDRREAIRRALALAGDGDVIVIAGKGHEEFQEFANRTIPFDDREVVRAELKTR